MILIQTALMSEAKPFIDFYQLKYVETFKKIRLYQSDKIILIISGIGKIKAAAATSAVISQFTNISLAVNIGISGTEFNPISSLYRINQIKDYQSNRIYYPEAELDLKLDSTGLLCVDKPLLNKGVLNNRFSLVDMESAGFFEACSLFLSAHQIELVKVVSDDLDINLITKDFIHSIISEKITQIDEFLQIKLHFLSQSSKNDSTDVLQWAQELAIQLKLSVTQTRKLITAATYFSLTKKEDLPLFTINEESINSQKRNAIFNKIVNRLYQS